MVRTKLSVSTGAKRPLRQTQADKALIKKQKSAEAHPGAAPDASEPKKRVRRSKRTDFAVQRDLRAAFRKQGHINTQATIPRAGMRRLIRRILCYVSKDGKKTLCQNPHKNVKASELRMTEEYITAVAGMIDKDMHDHMCVISSFLDVSGRPRTVEEKNKKTGEKELVEKVKRRQTVTEWDVKKARLQREVFFPGSFPVDGDLTDEFVQHIHALTDNPRFGSIRSAAAAKARAKANKAHKAARA